MKCFAALLAWVLMSAAVHAVQPDEILKDPALEARARAMSTELRCLVCQNQSIDESDAPLARDLRILIREQLQQNKSDTEIMEFVVSRYGQYVLLKPPFGGASAILWLFPFVLLAGAGIYLLRNRRHTVAASAEILSAEEERRLQELLNMSPDNEKP